MNQLEKLRLQWNDFQENLNSSFKQLRNDEELSDVTLVSDDGGCVGAHKVVLALSSPFFSNILKRSKNSHPFVFLRGVKKDALLAMLDFLLKGETDVFQDDLDQFLSLTEDFQLNSLIVTGSDPGQKNKDLDISSSTKKLHLTPTSMGDRNINRKKEAKSIKVESKPRLYNESSSEMRLVNNQLDGMKPKQLDEQVKSMIESSGKSMTVGNTKRKVLICKVCGKEGQLGHIRSHIEANHIVGVAHTCGSCGKTFRSREKLRLHKRKHHA